MGESWQARLAGRQHCREAWRDWRRLVLNSDYLGGAVSMETFKVRSCFVSCPSAMGLNHKICEENSRESS